MTTMKSPRSQSSVSTSSDRFPRLLGRQAADELVRDKGSKSQDSFEVWHHHGSLRRPSDWALLLQFDQRR